MEQHWGNQLFVYIFEKPLELFVYKVSDDEDDTHPNIDTPSLFKWRHEARVKRMEELANKKKAVADERKKWEFKILILWRYNTSNIILKSINLQ